MPASDVGNLAVMGYDPHKYYSGRGPLFRLAQTASFAVQWQHGPNLGNQFGSIISMRQET